MALCDELEVKLTKSQRTSEKLMESVVREIVGGTPPGPLLAKEGELTKSQGALKYSYESIQQSFNQR